MPQHPPPAASEQAAVHEAARQALRRYCAAIGGKDSAAGRALIARRHGLSLRRVERIHAGSEPMPTGLARALAGEDPHQPRAAAFAAWADFQGEPDG